MISAFTYRQWAILMVLSPLSATAQIVHNGSSLYLGEGVQLHVDGSVLNNGFIQNQGEWFTTGDWTNTQVYQGLGRLTLNGSATQRLMNNGNSLYSLRIDSRGPVDVLDNVVIDNRLDLLRGVVRVSGGYSLTASGSATVGGGSIDSFVEGPLISRGTGYKYFPVGKSGRFYPVELLDVSGIDPVVQIEAFADASAFRLDGYGRVLSSAYWEQRVLSGTYSGSAITAGDDLPDNEDRGIEIYQSSQKNELFTPLGNTTIVYESPVDKVTTSNPVTRTFFLIGRPVNVAPGEAAFYFPTSLSPDAVNPDNRSVRVFGDQLSGDGFLFEVYNRWGQKVFESRSLEQMTTKGWSGEQQLGGTLASGAYPYLIRGKRTTGEVFEQKGVLSIVR